MPSSSFQIGDVLVLPDKNEIRTPTNSSRVEHRLIQILQVLANAGGTAVSKQEIAEQVWAPKTMSDESLAQAISQLRKYLGDSAADSQIIQTIPKVGYSLVAPVQWVTPPAHFLAPGDQSNSSSIQLLLGALCVILAALLLLNFIGHEEIEIEEIEIELSDSYSL